ncbi:MAG: xylulokinase [Chloroflexota bacterium]|jgi:xylulokinase
MASLIIAHDLGTSGDKASLHAADGRLLAAHTAHYPVDFGPGGKAEQDPADWWAGVCEATRALLAETATDPADVACVAMSGQMMGAVLVDAQGDAVRPAVIWADTRAQAETRALAAAVGAERGYRLLGHRLDPTCSLPKMMWLREHDAEAWARTSVVLQAKDYLTLRLTGRRCIDPSDASGTNAYDQLSGEWSDELLDAAGIDRGLMPEIVPSASVAGGLTRAAAAATGLLEGTPVVVGGADGCTSALGVGLVGADSGAVVTLGTSAWISMIADEPVRDPEARVITFDHVVPDHFVPLGAMQSAGASLGWFTSTVGVDGRDGMARLVAEAAEVEAARDGLFFLPYLLGERAPIWDANARGTFIGISHSHRSAHLARAVLEGVAFNLYGIMRALAEVVRPIDGIDAVGGGANSDAWLQIMADTWGVPVRRRTIVDEANSLGAAVVGGIAVGLIDDWSAARALSGTEAVFEPDDARHASALRGYARFTDAYQRLKDWFAPPIG